MENKQPPWAVKIDRIGIMIIPVIISIGVFFAISYFCKKSAFSIDANEGIEDFKVMLGVWGTLLGFLITAVSIFLTLKDTLTKSVFGVLIAFFFIKKCFGWC